MRARRFVGLVALVYASGCVALTGLDKLTVGDDAPEAGTVVTLPDGAVGIVTSDGSVVPVGDASPDVPDANDSGSGPTDAGVTDTGAPDTGPVDSGSTVGVRCGGSKVCSGAENICCYFAFGGNLGSCTGDGTMCASGTSFACDGDEDCGDGKVCCVNWNQIIFQGTSSCQSSCDAGAFSGVGLACANDPGRCLAGQSCKAAPDAPPTISACQ